MRDADATGTSELSARELHVWTVRLDCDDTRGAGFDRELSSDELQRAGRFRFLRDRNRFVAGRFALRALLARYTGTAASTLRFTYGEFGKPQLDEPFDGLRFNLAHSGGLAVYVFGRFEMLGIDVEQLVDISDVPNLGRRFFAPSECAGLSSLPENQRLYAFYRCWTQKEAYLKALGHGLAKPLDAFEVSVGFDEPARLRFVADDPQEADEWSMFGFEPADGAVGAVIVRGRPARVAFHQAVGAAALLAAAA